VLLASMLRASLVNTVDSMTLCSVRVGVCDVLVAAGIFALPDALCHAWTAQLPVARGWER